MQQYYRGKTFVVTGAAGFIGSHLVERLIELDANVIGVDNFLTGQKRNLAPLIEKHGLQLRFIEADVTLPPEEYWPLDQKIDGVFHLASPASPPLYQQYPVETYLVNSLATHQLLSHLTHQFPEARFLFASTSEVYGDPQVHPQVESYWGNVNPNGIRSCYDEAKRLGETICGVFERDFGLDVRIVRIFNTYGPRMDLNDGRIIPNFIKQALNAEPLTIYGDGSQTRSYCYVSDLVEGLVRLLGQDGLKGQTVNLGNPREITVKKTGEIIQEVVNGHVEDRHFAYLPLPKDDPTRRKPDITKAKELLDWQPSIVFEDGLKKTIEYFRKVI